MKKGIILIAVVLMLLSLAACGSTETPQASGDIDLSKFTDEEIIALNKSVQEEIVARNIEKSAVLIPGQYLVGTDIPAGAYHFHGKAPSNSSLILYVYPNNDKREPHTFYQYISSGEEGSWDLTLIEGDLLAFDDGELTLTVSAGGTFG